MKKYPDMTNLFAAMETRKLNRQQDERARVDALRLELTALFGEGFYVSESNDPDTPPWEVHGFLSEEGVRKLAGMLQRDAKNHPLIPVYGRFRDDPTWDEYQRNIEEHRGAADAVEASDD